MSAAGTFVIVANDGKSDRMIMASELLQSRISDIMYSRRLAGYADPTPTLLDIERTHVLFVNSHFKPFAALAYEYNKVSPNSGTPALNGDVTFSIPQFGDFFNDMVVHVTMPEVSVLSPGTAHVAVTSNAASASNVATGAPTATVDARYVGPDGKGYASVEAALADDLQGPFVRYFENPGLRLLKKVKFDVNGNPLDQYNRETASFHQKFWVPKNKETGYNRLIGQENPVKGYTDLCSVDGSTSLAWNTPADATLVALGCDEASSSTSRRECSILNGPQTPKATQPAVHFWIPLEFWFNKDCRLSIPSVSIPFGQRFVNLELASLEDVCAPAPGDISVEYSQHNDVTDNSQLVRMPLHFSGVTLTQASGFAIELYINNIFVNPEIHDIYIKRIGFTLIRVHREQAITLNAASSEVLLSQLKWPTEYIQAGVRPNDNVAAHGGDTSSQIYRTWHRMTSFGDEQVCGSVAVVAASGGEDLATNDTGGIQGRAMGRWESCRYYNAEKTVDTVKVTAHGIPIYQELRSEFFNSYLPYRYGGPALRTPDDEGALFINFCLYPGTYQPSGHINISRSREFYIKIDSSVVTSNNHATLLVSTSSINFLLVSDGSASLRYST